MANQHFQDGECLQGEGAAKRRANTSKGCLPLSSHCHLAYAVHQEKNSPIDHHPPGKPGLHREQAEVNSRRPLPSDHLFVD